MKKGRVAIFLSGRGSNFEAIYRHSQQQDANFEIVVVISDKADARGLATAKRYGLDAYHIAPKKYAHRRDYEREIVTILDQYKTDLICLAGYMRIVGSELLSRFPNKILNIHPALLPSFPGLDGQKQALEYGVKVTGCTVHFVDSGIDTGPIILQKAVIVEEEDDEEVLSRRILEEEHRLYSQAIRLYFDNRLIIEGRRVKIKSQ